MKCKTSSCERGLCHELRKILKLRLDYSNLILLLTLWWLNSQSFWPTFSWKDLATTTVGNSHRSASPRPTTLEEDQELFVDFSSIPSMFMIWDSSHEDLQLFDWVSNTGHNNDNSTKTTQIFSLHNIFSPLEWLLGWLKYLILPFPIDMMSL